MTLSNEAKVFLRELQFDPRWKEVLDSITRPAPAIFRPKPEVRNEEQTSRWMYESGRFAATQDILAILKVESNGG